MDKKEVKGFFRYEQDSKRYHRFKIEIETDFGIVGTVYIQKGIDAIPKRLILEYADRGKIDTN